MFPDLLDATRTYWKKLDTLEAAYQQGQISLEEVDVEVKRLMAELGDARRRALKDFWASLLYFVQQQREAIAGFAVLSLLAYVWLVVSA